MDSLQISKFSPPRFEPDRHLPRYRIISHLQAQALPLGRTILIEGQAGQGKSQLAVQFLHLTGATFAWFQLGKEDADPVLLLRELVQTLQLALPEFVTPEVESWLVHGSQIPENCQEIADALLSDLESYLSGDFYLILDDLHLLENQKESLRLISSLLTGIRKKFHLILISRLPVLALLQIEGDSPAIQSINNADLVLNRQEIAELFNVYFKIPISPTTVNDLYESNEGWVMGLVLAAQGGSEASLQSSLPGSWEILNRQGFLDFFSREVLLQLPEELQGALISLSLLDEIPSSLAGVITGKTDIAEQLRILERKNFFIRSLDQDGTLYSFHHLLQECLNHVAEEQYGIEAIHAIWNTAGEWYRESLPEKALSYFLRAANYVDSQSVLSTVGMQLLASNRLVTLRELLSLVPEDAQQCYPWLSFYKGVVRLSVAPPDALPFLEEARGGFIRDQNEIGELAALVQVIFFHTAVDCQFKHGQALLERAICLYEKYQQTMEENQKAHAANIFVVGLTFFSAELERTEPFAVLGLKIAQKLGLKDLEAEARLARCYRNLFAGNLMSCRQEIEDSLALITDPQVSLINRCTLHLAQLNLLVNEGDMNGYEYHRRRYLETYGEELVDQSSFGAIMRYWEIDLALAQRDEAKIEEILRIALASVFGSSLPHMRSLYLQYQAYLLALQNKNAEAFTTLKESQELRRSVGGREFEIMNHVLVGATHFRLGYSEEALQTFHEGLKISEEAGEIFVRPGLYAHRAWLHIKQGDYQCAEDDIRSLLSTFERSGFRSFYGWDPEVMEDILREAVRLGIMPDLARELSARRLGIAIGDGEESFPLLQVHGLGPLALTCKGVTLSDADITPAMRQLLSFLIATPSHCLDQESVQNALWPEETPARGRSNFDALVSRVRKLLQNFFPQIKAREVLSLKRGVLCLKNCWVDLDDFNRFIHQGISLRRNGNDWQAGNALHRGLNLWRGEFFGKSFAEVDLGQTRNDLLQLYLKGSMEYGRLLSANGQAAEAVDVITKALAFEPTNEPLVRKLYELQIQQGKPHLANQTLRNYASALRCEDCTDAEIEQVMEAFWT